MPPLKKNEKLTLALSSLALLASLASLYFQFFYISEAVMAAKMNFDAALGNPSGVFSLDVALINNGNRDALVLRCQPQITGVKFVLENPPQPAEILKPHEIKPLLFRGSYEVPTGVANGEIPVELSYRVVGARGFDVQRSKRIGSVVVVGGALVGIEILKRPVDLD